MVEIRKITFADLGAVNALLVRAFSQARKQEGMQPATLPLCCEKFLHLYLQDTPDACFVALERGRIIAVVFGHRWGKLAWLGPLAVSPDRQGHGIGKAIVKKVVAFLRGSGCCCLGLETNPSNLRNINFYSGLDFIAGPLTVDLMLKKSTATKQDRTPGGNLTREEKTVFEARKKPAVPSRKMVERQAYSEIPAGQRRDFIKETQRLCRQVDAGIDYTRVIDNLDGLRYGDAFLYKTDGEPVLSVALQTGAVAVGEKAGIGRVLALTATMPGYQQQLAGILMNVLEAASLHILIVRIPAVHSDLIRHLRQCHFSVVHTTLRMYLAGYAEQLPNKGLFLTKWE